MEDKIFNSDCIITIGTKDTDFTTGGLGGFLNEKHYVHFSYKHRRRKIPHVRNPLFLLI